MNPPCDSGDCFYRKSRMFSANADAPALWSSQHPGGTEYIAISHTQLSPMIQRFPKNNRGSNNSFVLFISVYGYSKADFLLTAYSSVAALELPDGVTVQVIAHTSRFF